MDSLLSPPLPAELILKIADPEEAKNLAVEVLRLIQIRSSVMEYAKIFRSLSKQFVACLFETMPA
jgi:hypothetical protein